MNPLYDFSDREIAVIDMALSAVIQATNDSTRHGLTPPDGLLEALVSTMNKIQSVIELRSETNQQFENLISQLNDVENVGNLISNSHDIPETNEYN